MNIRQRILVITITVTVFSVIALSLISNTLFLNHFRHLEADLMRQDLTRAREALQRDLGYLDSIAADWGYWNETHNFLLGKNPGYPADNLTAATLDGLGVDAMLFYDAARQPFYHFSINPVTLIPAPLPADIHDQVQAHLFAGAQIDPRFSRSGILPTDYGAMLVAARAVLSNDAKGQPAGVLVIGMYINNLRLEEWERATRLTIRLHRLDDPQLPSGYQATLSLLLNSPDPVAIQNIDRLTVAAQRKISGYALLDALNGEPYLLLAVEKSPAVYASGVRSFDSFLLLIVIFGALVASFSWFVFHRSISDPLFAIINTIQRFRESRDFSISIPLRGKDELSRLSLALSGMISDLGQYHQRLAASERQFRELLQKLELIAVILDRDGRVTFCNEYLVRLSSWDWQQILQCDWFDQFAPPNERVKRREKYLRSIQRETLQHVDESFILTRDGEKRLIAWNNTFLRAPDNTITGMARIGQDITGHRKNEEKIRKNLKETNLLLSRLNMLREIDSAIISNHDSAEKIHLILGIVKHSLEIDAVNVFTESIPGILVPHATNGFNLAHIPPILVQNKSADGESLNPDQLQILNHLRDRTIPEWLAERFSGYPLFNFYAVAPMTIEGRRYGIVEVFARRAFKPDHEWQNHFQTVANQIAIAIDHGQMIHDIQRANQELKDAYQATIQGWSATLEMRDKETRGHSERMLDLTERLATRLGLNEKQLTDLCYGVLLHDIGKMAVPDSILNKPAPLNEHEWEIMRQHPQFAFNLLADIPFLRGAMDVIYCHHERWNGSGYPQGLKGERIPFSARIFAIVDVWDALTNDRPYRSAWSTAKALGYLEQQAGIEFDPRVVEAFAAMICEQEKAAEQVTPDRVGVMEAETV
ncbi:MAG: CHASE4 domain-containing protein [Bellilinea sp.]